MSEQTYLYHAQGKQPCMAAAVGVLQRKCACGQHTGGGECAECGKQQEQMLQRAAVNAAPTPAVSPIVHDVLNSLGHTLDASTRACMEPHFGHDFSGVKVHTDARAAESARAVNALAYTVGNNVVFGAGQYLPETMTGKRLLAHELTHVVQQGGEPKIAVDDLKVGQSSDMYEREARAAAEAPLFGQKASHISSLGSNTRIQREATSEDTPSKAETKKTCALTTFTASNFTGKTVTADVEFISALNAINAHAVAHNVNLYITDSFREAGAKVKGAIVTPAKMSNHFAGHAIDMNVQYGPKNMLCNSTCLAGKLPEGVSGFIEAIQADKNLRWGGDFSERDPVHIDDYLNKDSQVWEDRYKAVQEARQSKCG